MSNLIQRSNDRKILTNEKCIDIFIPGYTLTRKAVVIKIELMISTTNNFKVITQGEVASTLGKIFKRNVEILSSLKKSYEVLKNLEYQLISSSSNWKVKDARSSGLPLCIALINVLRKLNGLNQVQHIAGTGILRIDGTFEKSHLEEEKKQATSQLMESMFISSQVCKHVFDLATLMNIEKGKEL